MSNPNWPYINNTFLNATDQSFRAAKKIGDYTVLALSSKLPDVFFNPLFATLNPLNVAYRTAYEAWLGQMGTQKAKTSSLTAEFKELAGLKIGRWDVAIQNVYAEGTEEYNNLFPNHRSPFQRGSQEDRLAALGTLHTKVSADSELPTSLKTDIQDVLTAINNQFNAQKSSKTGTKSLSDDLEEKRIALCIGLYSILGLLMSHYASNPSEITKFFDLETIRNHEQSIFRNSVQKGKSRLVMTHSFAEGEDVKLINDGDVALKFYLAAEANDPLPLTAITVEPGQSVIKDASELGAATSRYLIAFNADAVHEGHYTVVLI